MKILGISGGMKDGSNDAMTKEALMGAKEAGAEVEFVRIHDLDIKQCTGCVACVKSMMNGKGNGCVIKDDVQWLFDKMLDADGIVIAMPIFEKGSCGIFHDFLDRVAPRNDRVNVMIADKLAKETGGKRMDPRQFKDRVISFMGIGGSDWATRVQVDHAMLPVTTMWKTIENICFAWSKNIIIEDEKVARAHRLGRRLAEAASDPANAEYRGDPGVCPHCHAREFYLEPGTTKVVCCQCGIEGDFVIADGRIEFCFDETWLEKAHDTVPGKFLHNDDIRKNETSRDEVVKTMEYRQRVQKYKDFIDATKPDKG